MLLLLCDYPKKKISLLALIRFTLDIRIKISNKKNTFISYLYWYNFWQPNLFSEGKFEQEIRQESVG